MEKYNENSVIIYLLINVLITANTADIEKIIDNINFLAKWGDNMGELKGKIKEKEGEVKGKAKEMEGGLKGKAKETEGEIKGKIKELKKKE